MDGILSPAFLQAACAHATPTPPPTDDEITIEFRLSGAAGNLVLTGEGTVEITYKGETTTIISPNSAPVSVTPEEDEELTIKGNVTALDIQNSDWRMAIIDTLNSTVLKTLSVATEYTYRLDIGTSLESLTLPNRSMKILYITYAATNENVSNALATAIEDADAAGPSPKRLLTNADAPYYSILSTAVNNSDAEWEIQPLS